MAKVRDQLCGIEDAVWQLRWRGISTTSILQAVYRGLNDRADPPADQELDLVAIVKNETRADRVPWNPDNPEPPPARAAAAGPRLAQRDETAFAMLHLSPDARERCFNNAFASVLAAHPDLTDPPPAFVAFVAAVYRRIAELEQHPAGTA